MPLSGLKSRWLSLPLLLAGLTVAPLAVAAQDPGTIADIRCVAVGIRFAEMPDSPRKSTGTLLVLYYMGRLDGRDPKLAVEDLLTEQIMKMTDSDYAAEAVRCDRQLNDKGQQIARMDQDMLKFFNKSSR